MSKKEDNPQPQPQPDNRRIYSRSVSWAAGKGARASLPPLQPLSVSRPKPEEWPRAGSDDLGVWPNIAAATPGAKLKPPTLPLNLNKKLGKPPREFEFKKDKLAYFDKECSRIIDHVYLGSDAVAKNRDVLRENGISHVLNCVGFVCPEYFKKDLVYKTLWLQDSPSEDITSILYDVFDYFEDVREQNGRVFVHCCQGVSRSTSLVIAYLMWREGQSYETAFQQVKEARGVTNPNMGFASQLLQCQKRVNAMPVSPNSVRRMYRIAPHSSYAPLHLVPKLLTQPNAMALDSRGAFIVNLPSAIYVWIGNKCDPLMHERARLAASQVIRYEKASAPALTVKEGEESTEFWNALGNDQDQKNGKVTRDNIVGQRKVVDYDIDFGVFDKAVNNGVVPPFSISGNDSEMRLPARRSGWEKLRRKIATAVMKDLIASSKEVESPDSCSSSQNWVKNKEDNDKCMSKNKEDNDKCMSPDSFSSFLVDDRRKYDNLSPSISPTTSETSNSFSFSPTSSNWSDLSTLETSDPNLNPNPGGDENPKNLVRTWSFSIDDDDGQDSTFEAENRIRINDQNDPDFVLYQWPTMERVEKCSVRIPESRRAYITYFMDILYIWVGHAFSGTEGNDANDWQKVGHDFLVKEGLETSSVIQVVKEGEEPEQLWKHLHCFSFQNTVEKDQNE